MPSLLIEASADRAFALSGALILPEQGMGGDKAEDVLRCEFHAPLRGRLPVVPQ